jgi:VanZ family protein
MSEGGLEALHIALRKTAHMAEFGILALLAYRSLAWRRSGWEGWSAPAAALLAVGLAVVDETHQTFTTSRMGNVTDVGWDALGALAALGSVWLVSWIRGRSWGWGRA